MKKGFGNLIHSTAIKHNTDPLLVAAVIHQESKGTPTAMRYEDGFFNRYLRDMSPKLLGFSSPDCSFATEVRLRAFSFGLMQIMGQVARERGFRGSFLGELLDPQINLDIGVPLLKYHIEQKGSVEKGLLRWNGGGDQEYDDKVLGHIRSGACHYLLSN